MPNAAASGESMHRAWCKLINNDDVMFTLEHEYAKVNKTLQSA